MKTFISVLLLLSCICLAADPYYGFYPSSLGKDFKRFTHNIFGFSIDMPVSWTFGVNGQPPQAVIFLYPNGMNATKLSPDFNQIEVGVLQRTDVALEQAHEYVMKGMRQGHPNLSVVTAPTAQKVNGIDGLTFAFAWKSKAGFTVTERVSLVPHKRRIFSVTARVVDRPPDELHDRIIATFQPADPQF